MRAYEVTPEVASAVEQTLQAMTQGQKAAQMMGTPPGNKNYQDIERSPDVDVAGVGIIRGYRYRDGGRGVNLDEGQDNRGDDGKVYSTSFPAPALRAASWDLDLERRVGEAIGDETAAAKNNLLTAPCMNAVRHPYWGRTQETYGEDSYLIGRMASAFVVGVQANVAACAKHFAVKQHREDAFGPERSPVGAGAARGLRAPLRNGGAGCRSKLRDGIVQRDQWREVDAKPAPVARYLESANQLGRNGVSGLRCYRLVGDARRSAIARRVYDATSN